MKWLIELSLLIYKLSVLWIYKFTEVMALKVTKFVTSRPIFVFVVLIFMVIAFGSIPITIWHRTTKKITNDVALFTEGLRSSLVSEIENIGKFIYSKTNSSAIGLARVIDSHLTNNSTHFIDIQTQVCQND